MRTMAFAVSVACLASPAAAADWRIVSWNDEFLLHIDNATISHSGAVTTYISKILYLKDQNLAQLESRVEMDCQARKYRNLNVSALLRSGKVETASALKDWRKIESGTNAERELLIVCTDSPFRWPR